MSTTTVTGADLKNSLHPFFYPMVFLPLNFVRSLFLTGCCIILAVVAAMAQLPAGEGNFPARHRQLVLVTSPDWDSSTGTLQLYVRSDRSWIPTGEKVAVVLGKNGLGWGRGLHAAKLPGPEKKEGDGKAPAGIFAFGDAFGYQKDPPPGQKFSYRQATARDFWVDAGNSSAYNSWVRIPEDQENEPKKYWPSVERMKRRDHLYELGLIVKHNMEPAVAGKGSAIFLHVWRSPGAPTLGCTAMDKQELISLLAWLDPEKHPLLIQAPEAELRKLLK